MDGVVPRAGVDDDSLIGLVSGVKDIVANATRRDHLDARGSKVKFDAAARAWCSDIARLDIEADRIDAIATIDGIAIGEADVVKRVVARTSD